MRGDVVVVDFPFTDLRTAKRRPALLVKVVDSEDVILCQITSQLKFDSFSIKLSNEDFETGSLHKDSFIRPNRIFTLHQNLILKKVGTLKTEQMALILRNILSFLEA